MMPQQRCAAVLAGATCDRAPRYIPGIACPVASDILGRPVNAGTGSLSYAAACAWMKGKAAFRDFEEQWLEDLAALYRHYDIDVYRVPYMNDARPSAQLDELTFLYGDRDGDYVVCQYAPDSGDFGPIEHGIAHMANAPEDRLRQQIEVQERAIADGALENFKLPERHRRVCERFAHEFFVVCNGGNVSVGMEQEDLLLLALVPDLMRRKVQIQAQTALALGTALTASPWPRVLVAGGDMASQTGPFYSPTTFREVMLPVLKWLFNELAKIDVHYMFRSDGNLWPVADMIFSEAGAPGYGEVDRDAGMDVAALRAKYPGLVVWTNVRSHLVACGRSEEVREEAEACIAESAGRRYVHGASNAILRGTPVANVDALFSV